VSLVSCCVWSACASRKGLRRTSDAFKLEFQYAETSLRAATAAVEQVGKSVKTETDILWGPADTALADESQSAATICVGSVGIGAIAHKLIGSTAAAVAERSHCPVAIIRTPHHKPEPGIDWIVVAIADEPDFDIVVEYAMKEAQLRQAPILAVGLSNEEFGHAPHHTLDRRLEAWKKRYPDVHVYPVGTSDSVAGFLGENDDESVQLAVVGRGGIDEVPRIVRPLSHAILRHGNCSVLIAR
jgi:nucleotide-binding universal stress UspA family protein